MNNHIIKHQTDLFLNANRLSKCILIFSFQKNQTKGKLIYLNKPINEDSPHFLVDVELKGHVGR